MFDALSASSSAATPVAPARITHDQMSTRVSLISLGHIEVAARNHRCAGVLFAEAATVLAEIGNDLYLPWCLEGLAAVAAESGEHTTAAQLDGAREAIQARTRMSIPPFHPAAHAKTLEAVRAGLGDDRFEATRDTGAQLPGDAVLRAALAATVGATGDQPARKG